MTTCISGRARAALLAAALLAQGAAAVAAADEAIARQVARDLLDAVAEARWSEAFDLLDVSIQPMLPATRLQATWAQLTEQMGEYAEHGEMTAEDHDGAWRLVQGVRFGRTPLIALVGVNAQGRVVGFRIAPAAALLQAQRPAAGPATADPDAPYVERELAVGEGGGALPATLTMPRGDGPHPAVALVHGSGPHDRDETIGPNKPFRDLAWGLAERGVAVLRYEKRTHAHAAAWQGMADRLTVREETVNDAVGAVRLLQATDGVRRDAVFVFGHSLGGLVLPRIAIRSPGLAGGVLAAAPTRPLEDHVLEQTEYLVGLDGTVTSAEAAHVELLRQQVARVKATDLSAGSPSSELPLGLPATYWLDLRGYDPVAAARRLPLPLLVLNGGRDYQVTRTDFDAWRRGLAGRPAPSRFELYPKLNHLFFEGTGVPSPLDYQRAGRVADSVLDDVAEWIHATAGARPRR